VVVIGLLCLANDSLGADCELLAAPGPAARKNGLPVLGFHPLSEPVCLSPFAIIWLKCTFWHVDSSRCGQESRSKQRWPGLGKLVLPRFLSIDGPSKGCQTQSHDRVRDTKVWHFRFANESAHI
jgi:hypothetical protein